MILREVMDEIVFSLLIAFNGSWQVNVTICQHIMITLHTILASTRNFVTVRLRNIIFALLPYLSGKAKAIEPPFCTKEIGKEKTRKLLWQRLDWQEKGILAKVVKDTQHQNKSRSGSCAWWFCGDSFVASFPALRARRRVLVFVLFAPVTFKFVPFLFV